MPVRETADRSLSGMRRLSGNRYQFDDPALSWIVTIGMATFDGVPDIATVDIRYREDDPQPVSQTELADVPLDAMRRAAITLHSQTTRRGLDGVAAEYERPDPPRGPRPRITQSERDDEAVIANRAARDRDRYQSPAEAAADALGAGEAKAKAALKLGGELGLPPVPRRGREI